MLNQMLRIVGLAADNPSPEDRWKLAYESLKRTVLRRGAALHAVDYFVPVGHCVSSDAEKKLRDMGYDDDFFVACAAAKIYAQHGGYQETGAMGKAIAAMAGLGLAPALALAKAKDEFDAFLMKRMRSVEEIMETNQLFREGQLHVKIDPAPDTRPSEGVLSAWDP